MTSQAFNSAASRYEPRLALVPGGGSCADVARAMMLGDGACERSLRVYQLETHALHDACREATDWPDVGAGSGMGGMGGGGMGGGGMGGGGGDVGGGAAASAEACSQPRVGALAGAAACAGLLTEVDELLEVGLTCNGHVTVM